MDIKDLIIIIVVLLIVGGALAYIIREKKRGNKCVGCPYSKDCAKKNGYNGCNCCNH